MIFEAIVRLKRTQPVDTEPLPPTQDQCADALTITRRQMDDVTAMLQSAVDILRDRVPIAVACLASASAGDEIIELLAGATNEDDVSAAIAHVGIDDPATLLDVAKRVAGLAELRDELGVTYKDFNTALVGLGRPALTNPTAHDQAFDYFVKSRRDALLARLQQMFTPKFSDGVSLDEDVKLRSFPGLDRDQSWLDDYEMPSDSVMAAQVNRWLQQHGALPLAETIGDVRSVDAVRTANRRTVTAAGDKAGSLVRSWCVKARSLCPQLWSGDGCGGRLADWADEQGLLDFSELQGLQPLLTHLERGKIWPTGMPHALDAASLSLTAEDLNRGQSEQEQQRALQQQERATITLGSRRFSVDPEGFADIAAAVRETMPPALLQTPFRIDTGPAPTGRRPSRDQSGPKSFYRNVTRYSEGHRQVIGLAAEVIALDWLKAQPQYLADAVITWRSGYKDKVEGGMEGDDTLGYDIEVKTKSRRFMFEVKGAAEDGTEFELTESEINAARRNTTRDAYRIIYVQHVLDPEQTAILLLPNPFSQRGGEAYRVVGSGLRYRFASPD